MTPEERQRFNDNYIIKTFHQDTQIRNWMDNLFTLNQKLNKNYDQFYQSCFYITLYELLNEGLKYIEAISVPFVWGDSPNKSDKYFETINKALKIKFGLSEIELQVIEYKRHCACHIFQDSYEYRIKEDDKLFDQRKGKDLDELRVQIDKLIDQYGGDKAFDMYLTGRIYSAIESLQKELALFK